MHGALARGRAVHPSPVEGRGGGGGRGGRRRGGGGGRRRRSRNPKIVIVVVLLLVIFITHTRLDITSISPAATRPISVVETRTKLRARHLDYISSRRKAHDTPRGVDAARHPARRADKLDDRAFPPASSKKHLRSMPSDRFARHRPGPTRRLWAHGDPVWPISSNHGRSCAGPLCTFLTLLLLGLCGPLFDPLLCRCPGSLW